MRTGLAGMPVIIVRKSLEQRGKYKWRSGIQEHPPAGMLQMRECRFCILIATVVAAATVMSREGLGKTRPCDDNMRTTQYGARAQRGMMEMRWLSFEHAADTANVVPASCQEW
jgi:hypothetical protein